MRADKVVLRSNKPYMRPDRSVLTADKMRGEEDIIEDWTNETPPALSAPNLHPRVDSPTPFVAGYARVSKN